MNQTDNMKNVSDSKENNLQADVVIVGTGVGGCFSALNLSEDLSIIMITKSDLESSDSFLAQGGICVLHDDDDYDSYFEDTMRAGHYENRKECSALFPVLFMRREKMQASLRSLKRR